MPERLHAADHMPLLLDDSKRTLMVARTSAKIATYPVAAVSGVQDDQSIAWIPNPIEFENWSKYKNAPSIRQGKGFHVTWAHALGDGIVMLGFRTSMREKNTRVLVLSIDERSVLFEYKIDSSEWIAPIHAVHGATGNPSFLVYKNGLLSFGEVLKDGELDSYVVKNSPFRGQSIKIIAEYLARFQINTDIIYRMSADKYRASIPLNLGDLSAADQRHRNFLYASALERIPGAAGLVEIKVNRPKKSGEKAQFDLVANRRVLLPAVAGSKLHFTSAGRFAMSGWTDRVWNPNDRARFYVEWLGWEKDLDSRFEVFPTFPVHAVDEYKGSKKKALFFLPTLVNHDWIAYTYQTWAGLYILEMIDRARPDIAYKPVTFTENEMPVALYPHGKHALWGIFFNKEKRTFDFRVFSSSN